MKPITIEKHKISGFVVKQGNKEADGVGFDELMGLIAALTMPEKRPCLNWMQTKEQREAWIRELDNGIDEINELIK